ncbi:MAG: aminoacyl-tRNA hydrolase [Gammaproteobacteria bacterium]|nr:aminoacyl-tRNA hydrolase [Gammaproteobacteria bacterium]
MALQLIVGLGNPGAQYDQTRHNAGFWFVDELARVFGASFKADKKSNSELATVESKNAKLWLLKPQQFMNRSGIATAAIANFYKIPADQILVAHDELDIAPGQLRIKQGGGHGGHNGLRDIDAKLGNKQYWRLRIGIGHPGAKELVTSHVLGKPLRSERESIDRAIDDVVGVRERLIAADMVALMNELHRR